MVINNERIIRSFNEQPIALAPQCLQVVEYLASARDEKDDPVPFEALCAMAYGFNPQSGKPFVYDNGLAFIPIQGMLLDKFNASYSFATGYDFIRSRFDAAMADPDVKGIVFSVDSPGGMVAGNFELAAHIREGRKTKPSLAIADTMAYSGGYSLASAAGRFVATPSGGVGSIGVVMSHVSVAKMYEDAGIKVTLIYAGKHKVDGSPFKELSDDAKARFQASIDKSYDRFVSLVAENRDMKSDAVRATEALTYDADEAQKIGLIDAVQEPSAALAAFRASLSGATTSTGGNAMSETTTPEEATTTASQATTDPNKESAVSDNTENKNTNVNAAADERARIKSIVSCDEAKGRESLAEHIAYDTSMSLEDAKKMLAAAPKQEEKKADNGEAFKKAMESGNPEMTADGGKGGNGNNDVDPADRIAATYQAVHGTGK